MFGGSTRDVAGARREQPVRERRHRRTAERWLQDRLPSGSRTPRLPPEHVIEHRARRRHLVGAGDEITINVSTGPEQREVPDVKGMTPRRRRAKLKEAGFEKFTGIAEPVDARTEGQGAADHPAGQSDVGDHQRDHDHRRVGSGHQAGARCEGQSPEDAQQILTANGFTAPPIVIQVDGPSDTADQVVGTVPPAGEPAAVDTPIQVQVSRGNQFIMPTCGECSGTRRSRFSSRLGWQNVGAISSSYRTRRTVGVPTNGVVTQRPGAGHPGQRRRQRSR